MQAVNTKKILYFDLDHTLVESYNRENSRSFLSKSATLDLSSSSEGIVDNPIVYKIAEKEQSVHKVKAFAREKFVEIFKYIKEENSKCTDGPKIFVRILTNNYYTQSAAQAFLTKFFGEIEFDGFANNDRQVPGFDEKHIPGTWKPLPGKGMTMNHDYNEKYKALGILKENIYLIDDSEKNCKNAELYGFNAIRMGTNPTERGELITYTERKDKIFETLNQIITS